jgi:hypothetical protein
MSRAMPVAVDPALPGPELQRREDVVCVIRFISPKLPLSHLDTQPRGEPRACSSPFFLLSFR